MREEKEDQALSSDLERNAYQIVALLLICPLEKNVFLIEENVVGLHMALEWNLLSPKQGSVVNP